MSLLIRTQIDFFNLSWTSFTISSQTDPYFVYFVRQIQKHEIFQKEKKVHLSERGIVCREQGDRREWIMVTHEFVVSEKDDISQLYALPCHNSGCIFNVSTRLPREALLSLVLSGCYHQCAGHKRLALFLPLSVSCCYIIHVAANFQIRLPRRP